jgi:hypothetical protein
MRNQLACTAAIAAVCAALIAHLDGEERVSNQPTREKMEIVSWNCAKLRKIWELVQAKAYPVDADAADVYFARVGLLEDMLRDGLSKEELHDLASSCATMPDGQHETTYTHMLYAAILDVLITSGDRDGLVGLLAARYVAQPLPGGTPTEAEIVGRGGVDQILTVTGTCREGATFRRDVERAVSHGYSYAAVVGKKDATAVKSTVEWFIRHKHDPGMGGKFTDAILIVTDAYSKSKIPAVRKAIARAIRSAFSGLGVLGGDDDEFVADAVKWYGAHKDRIELDLVNYCAGPSDIRDPRALFKLEKEN